MRLLRALAAAVLVGTWLAMPLVTPPYAAAGAPLPTCRIDDVLTAPRGYDDWRTTLVDWILSVGPGYKPPDLVSVRNGGVSGGGRVRELVIDDLRAMADAAEANGTPLVAWSPYRGYKQQRKLFNGYANGDGFQDAITYSARPGHSEHQLGVTIDFVAVGDKGLTSNWDETPTGRWMKSNAWKYGWLMSYPRGKQAVACYGFEPWHYRYFGRELAAKIRESGLTTREYLWANFTTVNPGTGEPPPSAGSAPSAPPTFEPSASPELSPVPSASETDAPTAVPSVAVPTVSPEASVPPSSIAVPLAGIDLPVSTAGLLLVVAVIGLVISLRYLRRSSRAVPRR